MKQRRLFSLRPPASSHLFTLNSSLYSLFIVLHNRYQLFQKALLAEGIELEEHGLTAARSDGGEKQVAVVADQSDIHADAVAAHVAVTLEHAHRAADRAVCPILAVLVGRRHAAVQHAVRYKLQQLIKIAG